MKNIIFLVLFALSTSAFAQDRDNREPVSSSSNPVSQGSDEMSGYSDGALGPNEKEKQEVRKRSDSMQGAPNFGGGMGTGMGTKIDKSPGTISAGAASGDSED